MAHAPIDVRGDSYNGMDLSKTISGIVDTSNENTQALEESIHRSAHLSFILNLFSFLTAIAGFVAQTGQYLHEQRKHTKRKRYAAHHKSNHAVGESKVTERKAGLEDPHAA